MKKIIYRDIGLIDYKEAWDFQKKIFSEVLDSKQNKLQHLNKNHLIFCEHPHVYTLGKSGLESKLLINQIQLQAQDAAFYKVDRGGDITYHGPGQIVGYPILNLESLNLGVKEYIHKLEETIILTLNEFSISSSRLPGAVGVWLDAETQQARKICAIGIKASKCVTMHGFAFNINTDLSYFDCINPCGFTDKSVTSLEKELRSKQDMEKVKTVLKSKFAEVFGVNYL